MLPGEMSEDPTRINQKNMTTGSRNRPVGSEYIELQGGFCFIPAVIQVALTFTKSAMRDGL